MLIEVKCQNCGKIVGTIDDAKIPEGQQASRICPFCKTKVVVKRGEAAKIPFPSAADIPKTPPIDVSHAVGRKCPMCGYERKTEDDLTPAVECPKCGVIYSKAEEILKRKEAAIKEEMEKNPPQQKQGVLDKDLKPAANAKSASNYPLPSINELLQIPLRHEIFSESFILVLIWVVYGVGLFMAGVVLGFFDAYKLFFIVSIFIILHGTSVFATRCFAFIAAFKQNAVFADRSESSKLKNLGYFLAVYGLGLAPIFLITMGLFFANVQSGFLVLVFILLSFLYAFLYIPMGLGMAAVYNTVNPQNVVKGAIVSIKWYLAALGVLLAIGVTGQGVIIGLFLLTAFLGIFGGISLSMDPFSLLQGVGRFLYVAAFAGAVFGIYLTVILWAYVGRVLRWHEDRLTVK